MARRSNTWICINDDLGSRSCGWVSGSRTGGRGKDPGQGVRREQGRPGESRSRRLGQSGPGGAWSGRSLRRTRKATAADRSQYRCAAHGCENGLGDRGHAPRVIESPPDGRRRRKPCARLPQPGRWPPKCGGHLKARERACGVGEAGDGRE